MIIPDSGIGPLASPDSAVASALFVIAVALETGIVARGLSNHGVLRRMAVPILATANSLAAVVVWFIARLGGQPVIGWVVIVTFIAAVVVKYGVALYISRVFHMRSDSFVPGEFARIARVVAVGSLVIALASINVGLARAPSQSRELSISRNIARHQVEYYEGALRRFVSEHGRVPIGYSELASSDEALRGFNERPLDPWMVPYRIPLGGEQGTNVVSAGPDRKFGTADDICSGPLDPPRNP